jgi:hypothetical protein
MDALRNSKKISLLAIAILFSYILFNLILDAPRKTQATGPLRDLKNSFYVAILLSDGRYL